MTVKEFAERAEITPGQAKRLLVEGKIAYTKIPGLAGSIRLAEKDVKEFLAKARVEAKV